MRESVVGKNVYVSMWHVLTYTFLPTVNMALKMVKMALKMVKNHKNYTAIFDRRRTFDFRQSVENLLKYSCFGYRLSRYIFPKLLKFPKALSKRMALVHTRVVASRCILEVLHEPNA